MPTTLILKRNLTADWAVRAGADEAALYTLFRTHASGLPMISPCYAAASDGERKQSYVLLHDLSSSHQAPMSRDEFLIPGKNVPPDHALDRLVETLARFHAYWWQHPVLQRSSPQAGIWRVEHAEFMTHIQKCRAVWDDVKATGSGEIPADLDRMYERLLSTAPSWWSRYLEPRLASVDAVTLIHGDSYPANFLCPLNQSAPLPVAEAEGTLENEAVYLIDWQFAAAQLGSHDLVNLCATFWTSKQRRGRERRLLRRYLATLHMCGISGYAWEDLAQDYRISLLDWVLTPLHDRADGTPEDYWWPKMQCLTSAFQDWRCEELLDGLTT
jgi:thiamine kinase-like enzyme